MFTGVDSLNDTCQLLAGNGSDKIDIVGDEISHDFFAY